MLLEFLQRTHNGSLVQPSWEWIRSNCCCTPALWRTPEMQSREQVCSFHLIGSCQLCILTKHMRTKCHWAITAKCWNGRSIIFSQAALVGFKELCGISETRHKNDTLLHKILSSIENKSSFCAMSGADVDNLCQETNTIPICPQDIPYSNTKTSTTPDL